MTDKIMTVKKVANYLDIHPMTLYKLAREGKVPAFKVGGQWRFQKKVLDRWVAQNINKNHNPGEK